MMKTRKTITEAEVAAMDFKPWEGEINTKCLPNNEQFTEDGLLHLITCRMALVMMYKTKAELSGMFERDGDAMVDLIEYMTSAHDFFTHFSELLDAARLRLTAAGASVSKEIAEKGYRGSDWGSA